MIIRWICEKCSKKWIYPIEKCVYCKGPVIKQKGAKIRVAGITKVAIPSPMHPIILYFYNSNSIFALCSLLDIIISNLVILHSFFRHPVAVLILKKQGIIWYDWVHGRGNCNLCNACNPYLGAFL